MEDIMKIVKFLEDVVLPIKDVSETIQNAEKNKKVDFLACYQGDKNLLTGKGAKNSKICG